MNGPSYVAVVGCGRMAAELMRNPRLNIGCILIVGEGSSDYKKGVA